MGKQSGYLTRLRVQQAIRDREQQRLTRQQCHDMAIIALHLAFGFGPDRVAKFDKKVSEVWNEYADMAVSDEKQMVYTKEKIDRVLREACGENFVPWDERYK